MRHAYRIAGVGILLLSSIAATAGAEEVRLNGAASVVTDLVAPNRGAVEKVTGSTLVIDKSNAGKGIIDLVEGKCDAAMASASLDATVQAARSAGLKGNLPDLKMHVVATSEVVFIVHPSNPVQKLTWEQIRDIHTGKITNWKEVGGKDLPIVVYTDAKASATRGLIKQVVMKGAEYAPAARDVDFVKKVNDLVAKDDAGIGGLGIGFVDRDKVRIVESRKVERPFAFVTAGEPAPKVRKVIDAFAALGRKK